jgi:hypothetical protein
MLPSAAQIYLKYFPVHWNDSTTSHLQGVCGEQNSLLSVLHGFITDSFSIGFPKPHLQLDPDMWHLVLRSARCASA